MTDMDAENVMANVAVALDTYMNNFKILRSAMESRFIEFTRS